VEEDYTAPGEVRIWTRPQTFGPYEVDYGTYKSLLGQWKSSISGGLITVVTKTGGEESLRCQDVFKISWKPAE
jgi:hypothetical protein